jgi:hypothetical protein
MHIEIGFLCDLCPGLEHYRFELLIPMGHKISAREYAKKPKEREELGRQC